VHVAQSLGVSRQSLYNWLARYQQSYDPAALCDHRGGGRPSLWTPHLQAALTESLAQPPDHWGYQAANWTVPLLIEHLVATSGQRLSDSTLRRELRRLGYVWKRPRYVLAPDPEREKKTAPLPPARPAWAAQRRPV
jgi:transposase